MKFKVGDEVIIAYVNDKFPIELLNKTFIIENLYEVTSGKFVAKGIIAGQERGIFTYKLEHLSVYESPLWKELR